MFEGLENVTKYGEGVDNRTGRKFPVYAIPMTMFRVEYDVPTIVSRHSIIAVLDILLTDDEGNVIGTNVKGVYRAIEYPRDLGYQ